MALPPYLRLHMLYCKVCRKEIHSLQQTFLNLKGKEPFNMLDDLSSIIMNAIYSDQVLYGKTVSSTKWLSVGSLIILSMLGLTFCNSFSSLKLYFGEHLEIPLNIVMGLTITIYVAFFIGSHLDETKKLLRYFYKNAN
jgi:hypothetical protein